jgi:hypothetical protein
VDVDNRGTKVGRGERAHDLALRHVVEKLVREGLAEWQSQILFFFCLGIRTIFHSFVSFVHKHTHHPASYGAISFIYSHPPGSF